jgi:hypothetical protein
VSEARDLTRLAKKRCQFGGTDLVKNPSPSGRFRAISVAFDLRLRLDAGGSGDQIMRSTSSPWMWVALVLALLTHRLSQAGRRPLGLGLKRAR